MWIRYTPNIALSNRLLQHGRPWLWVSKPIICSCASRRSHHECHPPQVDCTWWGYPAGAWLFDRNTRTSQRLCSEETSLRGALRATWGVKKHLVAWVLQRILKYIFFLVTPKYAKKRHKGKNQVLPNCAFSTRNVVFFQIQWSGEWFNCNHPSIEPFAAQRCFCTRNSRNSMIWYYVYYMTYSNHIMQGVTLQSSTNQYNGIRERYSPWLTWYLLHCSFALILMVSGIHVERSLSCADDVEDYTVV